MKNIKQLNNFAFYHTKLALTLICIMCSFVSCVVEEEEEDEVTDVRTLIQQALNSGTSVADLLEDYNTFEFYGLSYQGGLIVYLNQSAGEGLIVSDSDLATDTDFYDGGSFALTGSTSSSFGAGPSNTSTIVNELGSSGNVAALCDNYSNGGYNDWFLPSASELSRIRSAYQSGAINIQGGNTNASYYWMSNISSNCPQGLQFVTGTTTPCVSRADVRAARIFTF